MSMLRLPVTMTVSLPIGEDGLLDRQCPSEPCRRDFKIKPGTGLSGENLPMYCPYCGHRGESLQAFRTESQVGYAQQVISRQVTDLVSDHVHQMFKRMWSNHGPLRRTVTSNRHPRLPIRYDGLGRLETDVECVNCTLQFSVFGVFAFCPDCKEHNSRSMLEKNLNIAQKAVQMADEFKGLPPEKIIESALADSVAAFDGFGNEAVRRAASRATNPARAENVKFQSLNGSRKNIKELFDFDLAAGVTREEWTFASKMLQKRHLLAHRMGVIDASYLSATEDSDAQIGRRISVVSDEVLKLVEILRRLGKHLVDSLPT